MPSQGLATTSGLPMYFDTDTLKLEIGSSYHFEPTEVRRAEDLRGVWLYPEAVDSSPVYYIHFLVPSPAAARNWLDKLNLLFGVVVMPPHKVGKEFPKTRGHYHLPMPSSTLRYPEVYSCLWGRLQYLLYTPVTFDDPSVIAECWLAEVEPGVTMNIPPGYAHVIINPTPSAGVMCGLWAKGPIHENRYAYQFHGAPYYEIEEQGRSRFVLNTHYQSVPPLRIVNSFHHTPFRPLSQEPLWTDFVNHPTRYKFLTSAKEAAEVFTVGTRRSSHQQQGCW